ncbi:ATP-binding protein [soil metagenome]
MSELIWPEPRVSRAAVFSRDTSSVASAREWLSEFLADEVPAVNVSDAMLLLSELVTNTLRHGAGDIVCRASMRDDDGRLCVAVGDASVSLPRVLPVDLRRVGGFGMLLVERIAEQWGVARYPGGKVVWATIAHE